MTRRTRQLSGVAVLCLAAALCFCSCGGDKKDAEKKDASTAEPSASADAVKAPKIASAQPTFNFGQIKQGKKVEHIFKVKNEGKADLIIERAKGS
jgi:hypothetical protein